MTFAMPVAERPSLGRRLLPSLMVIIAAVSVLLAASPFLWTGTFHTYGLGHSLNDQTGYVTAARNLAASCSYESSVYYPAKLLYYKSHNLPYMPGNYYIRAAFFKTFGYSPFVAMLPNMIAFVLSALLLYHIARELFDERTAAVTAFFFLIFPPVVLYSYTAMMEIVFLCSCLFSFYLFLRTPGRWRHIVGPLLVVLPFLVRETAVFMVVGLAAMIYRDGGEGRLKRVLIFLCASAALVFLLGRLPQLADRPPTFYARLLNSPALHYFDAYALQGVHLDRAQVVALVWRHFFDNVNIFWALLVRGARDDGFRYFLLELAMLGVCVGMLTVGKGKGRGLLAFLVLTSFSLLAAVFLLYDYYGFTGLRLFLFLFPLYLCAIVGNLMSAAARLGRVAAVVVLVMACAGSLFFFSNSLIRFQRNFAAADAFAGKCAAFLDSLHVGDSRFFVAPHEISLDYVVSHYPLRWSFLPSNEATLQLIARRFPVGAVIVPVSDPLARDQRSGEVRKTLAGGTFVLAETKVFGRVTWLIFRPA